MNIRVFILVALFAAVLLQAGTVDAIIVKNATSTWNTTAENIPEDITTSPRIIAEYSHSIFSSDLDTPGNLTALPRIVAEYSHSIFSFYLDPPGNLTAAPRIIAEYSNSISSFYLDTPGNITAAPRIIATNTNSIRSTNFAFPVALFNDTAQPVITNVTAANITDNSATIKWDTDEISDSLVKYGKVSRIYTESEEDTSLIKNHTIELTSLLPDTCYHFVVNSTDRSKNSAESSEYNFTTSGVPTPTPPTVVFDTEAPANPYHSISGTHNGTITPNQTIEVAMLYTYPCAGTGGHSKYVKIWNNSDWNVTARWERYSGDWRNISFGDSFTLEEGETYNYTIRTGSYPQIHHTDNLSTSCGVITCSEFIDANGKVYNHWIPAIRLLAEKNQSTQTEFTDKEILDAAYSGYKYPEGFYQEDLHGGSLYYENTVSIKPVGEREHIWIELCTNNKSQALEWSESSSKNSAYYRDLVDEKETEKYFEFRRVYSNNPSDVILSRVHKCSYLNTKYDKSKRPSILGAFNQRPVTIEKVKGLIEYLWFIENYNMGGQKVLRSFTENQGNSVKHTIYKICIVYRDWDVCDVISLFKSEYIVDKNSGEITVYHEIIKTVT